MNAIQKKLLTGTAFLKNPQFNRNVFDQEDRLLRVALMAYLKHHLNNDDIGWNELGNALQCEICNTIGDDAFCEWVDQMKSAEVEP